MIVKRTKAGLKRGFKPLGLLGGAALGAAGGGFLGSRKSNKAGNISSIIGAGVGALGVAAIGYRKGVKEWDYNNDPEILKKREEEGRKELLKNIESYLLDCRGYSHPANIKISKELEKKYNFKFKPDWYKFLQISSDFFRKNATTWYKTIENCKKSYDFLWPLTIENSDCNLLDIVPLPGLMNTDMRDGELVIEDLLSVYGSDPYYFVNFLPKENKYELDFNTYDNLVQVLNTIDYVSCFKKYNNNGQKEPYKDNPDIYNTHLKIIEEYARLLKQIR